MKTKTISASVKAKLVGDIVEIAQVFDGEVVGEVSLYIDELETVLNFAKEESE